MDNTDRLNKTSDQIEDGYKMAKETESIGMDIIDNLQNDRETLNRIRGRVRLVHYAISFDTHVAYSNSSYMYLSKYTFIHLPCLVALTIQSAMRFAQEVTEVYNAIQYMYI